MTVNYDELRREVLQLAHEDLMGLWEAWWRANAMYPEAAVSERLAYTERVISDLVADGLIDLYRGDSNNNSLIPIAELDAVLRDPVSWHPYPNMPVVLFLATS